MPDPAPDQPNPDPDQEARQEVEAVRARLVELEARNRALQAQVEELKPLAAACTAPEDPRRLHLLQIQWVRDILVFALILAVFWLGYILRPITIPVLLALTLAYLVEPIVDRVVRRGWMTRVQAAASVVLLIVVVITVPLGVGLLVGVNQAAHAGSQIQRNYQIVQAYVQEPENPANQEALRTTGKAWRLLARAIGPDRQPPAAAVGLEEMGPPYPPPEDWLQDHPEWQPPPGSPGGISAEARQDGGIAHSVRKLFEQNLEGIARVAARQIVGTGTDAFQLAARLLKWVFVTGFSLFLVLFFFFFLCTGYGRVMASLANLIPRWRKTRTLELLRQMDAVIAGFVRGRLIIMGILMVAFSLGYWLIGVPGWLIVGPITGILAIVPYLGLVSIPTSMLLMWLQPVGPAWQQTWWWILLAPVVLYFLIQTVEDYILTPLIQGKTTQMDTPTILFAVLAGGILMGFYGVLLAIPVGACIKILLRESFWPRFRAWAEGRVKDFLPISRYDPAEATLHSQDAEG
jgi:predicted PurR-regulated permease PerM